MFCFFFSSRRRHTRSYGDWSSDVCSSDLIPWAARVWALPFLTVLAPSERYHQEREMAHKTLTDWARQMMTQVRRWLPDRAIVVVADSSYAVLKLLASAAQLPAPVTMITRLRLDAALY